MPGSMLGAGAELVQPHKMMMLSHARYSRSKQTLAYGANGASKLCQGTCQAGVGREEKNQRNAGPSRRYTVRTRKFELNCAIYSYSIHPERPI
jgi:hypothetical protein